MGRLIVFIVVVGIVVAIAAAIGSFVGQAVARPDDTRARERKEVTMVPTQLQKVAYVALLVLITGVASGWLGGL